ncbi:MAG: 23S rRNA (guanosine(2251)-2'-O)-methyltransferase RlmB [Melioribacteraceae bacterium]|nr:23S rRNA (guanosine(2251)-2'-O)-methyltransferase RlmB [Melioribacteraceae bacterium]
MENKRENPNRNFIIGRKPVWEALNSNAELSYIYICKEQLNGILLQIKIGADKAGIPVKIIPLIKINNLFPKLNHQGVVAAKAFQKFYELNEVIDDSKKSKYPLLLILDSIQDPHNVGAIIRTAEASGVDGILTTIHNSAPINETVEKTSAGALSHSKICRINNVAQTIDILKQEGFWIIGSSLQNSKKYTEIDYKIPVAVIMGNEEKGIRKLAASKCDFLINIPMKGNIQSLNVSVATGVLLYEILRQRSL